MKIKILFTQKSVLLQKNNTLGFTLVELMIVVLLSGLIGAAIFSAYSVQQRVYTAQAEVVEMQQNIRAGLGVITREIREAGFDPRTVGGMGIANGFNLRGSVQFTKDKNADTVPEVFTIGFGLDANGNVIDADGNGIPDNDADGDGDFDPAPLSMNVGGNAGPIADNIERIEFIYRDINGAAIPVGGNTANIRSIDVSIVARAGASDSSFFGVPNFVTLGGNPLNFNNNNVRRRFVTTTIRTRDIGL